MVDCGWEGIQVVVVVAEQAEEGDVGGGADGDHPGVVVEETPVFGQALGDEARSDEVKEEEV